MSTKPKDATSSANLLAARVALLTQPVQHRLGIWKVHPTPTGAILCMSQCGLGDAGFLPQAILHGRLDLRRKGLAEARGWADQSHSIVMGEIRWPVDRETGTPILIPPPETPLTPEAAARQSLSILIHIFVPSKTRRPHQLSKSLEAFLSEVQATLAAKCWQGLTPEEHQTRQQRSTMNLHLATRQKEPLTPYEFEHRVMPILREVARLTRQDGLLLRFENPSTNFLVYCAAQHAILAKGQPCPARHKHPA